MSQGSRQMACRFSNDFYLAPYNLARTEVKSRLAKPAIEFSDYFLGTVVTVVGFMREHLYV